MVKKNVTTVELNGLAKVQFDKEYNYFFVNNISGGDVLMSTDLIVEGADGVITIPDGASYGTMHGYATDTVYVKGNGKVQVMGTYSAFNPFKAAVKGGEIKTAVGTDISIINSVDFPLLGLNVYGKSRQNGVPSSNNMVPIESIGDSGSLKITTLTSDDLAEATITTALPLRGIPVADGGNYTDSNGQQWVCDMLVYSNGTGKIIRYIDSIVLDGSADENWTLSGSAARIMSNIIKNVAKPNPSAVGQSKNVMPCLCDQLTAISPYSSINGIEGIAIDYTTTLALTFADLVGNSNLTAWTDRLAVTPVTVVYQLANPVEIVLTEAETKALLSLRTYDGMTSITNSENAEMSVKYLTSKAISDAVMPIISALGG